MRLTSQYTIHTFAGEQELCFGNGTCDSTTEEDEDNTDNSAFRVVTFLVWIVSIYYMLTGS